MYFIFLESQYEKTQDILSGMKKVYEDIKPDIALVHGDTTTAFAAALAAFYLNIPVGHVEAGLRTYDTHSPYPEEFNRQAIDSISDVYFAPTEDSKQNLLKEGKMSLSEIAVRVGYKSYSGYWKAKK